VRKNRDFFFPKVRDFFPKVRDFFPKVGDFFPGTNNVLKRNIMRNEFFPFIDEFFY